MIKGSLEHFILLWAVASLLTLILVAMTHAHVLLCLACVFLIGLFGILLQPK